MKILRVDTPILNRYYVPFTVSELRQINNCRMFLQVIFLSEITKDNGKHILECALYGHIDNQGRSTLSSLSTTTADWPVQPRPDSNTWATWKKFISLLTLPNSSTKLLNPLGNWIQQAHPIRTWHYRLHCATNVITSHVGNVIQAYQLTSNRTRNGHRYHLSSNSEFDIGTIPVTPTSISATEIVLPFLPTITYTEEHTVISTEDPVHYEYLYDDARTILNNAKTITLASDGGLLYEDITFGSVIVADSTPVITISGKAPIQNWPSSLTAESHGAYYAAKCINELFPPEHSIPPVKFLADNQSLLDGLRHRTCRDIPTNKCLQPEHEILYSTVQQVHRSTSVTFQNVKGHQDPSASFEASLNNQCDSLATAARQFPLPAVSPTLHIDQLR
jgi:hypothetical protein